MLKLDFYMFIIYRWAFDPDNTAAQAVWRAFHDHQQTGFPEGKNKAIWEPIVVAGNVKVKLLMTSLNSMPT